MWHMTLTGCPHTMRTWQVHSIHTHKHRHTDTFQYSPVNIGQGEPDRISLLHFMNKCARGILWVSSLVVHVYMWCACACVCERSISQLSSQPPYAKLGAQAGSICRVNAQPQPQAAGPYKPHYSRRNQARKHKHTHVCSDRQTDLIEPRTIIQ